jgi:hypothetical protein
MGGVHVMKAIALVLAIGLCGTARAETCMKSDEQPTGNGTRCEYQCSFGLVVSQVGIGRLCPLTHEHALGKAPPAARAEGGVCVNIGEEATGMTKQCLYDCGGRKRVMTVDATRLCPIGE